MNSCVDTLLTRFYQMPIEQTEYKPRVDKQEKRSTRQHASTRLLEVPL